MRKLTGELPKFDRPPVAEVVLGMQFPALTEFNIGHVGLYWQSLMKTFPRLEHLGPLPHEIERPALRLRGRGPMVALLSGSEALGRVWFINDANTDLIQLQPDRFVRNWRRYHDLSIPYPSYETLRPSFLKDLAGFSKFVAERGWSALEADQCEVTYINHIETCDVWQSFDQLANVFRGWSSNYPALGNSPTESVSFKARHEVKDTAGSFVGRLFVELDSIVATTPGSPSEHRKMLQLQLSVRGRPLGEGTEGVTQFMDLAHELIVNSFAEITTPEMHKVWGKTR